MLIMLPLPETKESTVVVIPADPSLVQKKNSNPAIRRRNSITPTRSTPTRSGRCRGFTPTRALPGPQRKSVRTLTV